MNIETRLKLEHLSETKELIRDAIQSKGQNVSDDDTFRSYAEKIDAIKTEPTLESLEVTENGVYTPSEGVDGFGSVTVDVPTPAIKLQDKSITENGTYSADEGFDGLGSVTVDVKGGGGSLPVGGYWGDFNEVTRPNNYNWNWFELGGDLYAFASKASASEGVYYKYKWVDGAWVQLDDITFIDAGVYKMRPVEYNGKLHFTPANATSKYHWTFDGTTVVQMANLPGNVEPEYLFAQDGKLKCYYNNKVYVWDEATDTWTVEKTLSFSNYNIGIFVDNDVVYMTADKKIYIYANKAVTQHATVDDTIYAYEGVVVNGKLYYYKGSAAAGVPLYCFDLVTKTNHYLVKIQTFSSGGIARLKSYHGKLLCLGAKYNYASNFQLYEVTE